VRVKDGQAKRQHEKNAGQPCSEFHQDIGRLRAEDIFRDPAAKCRSQAFALWPLHQDHQYHERRNQHEQHQQQVDQKVHWDAKYRRLMSNVE
jgi:hypothetical protein